MERADRRALIIVSIICVAFVGLIAWSSVGTAARSSTSVPGGKTLARGSIFVSMPAGWKAESFGVRVLTAWDEAKFRSIDCEEGAQLDVRLQIDDVTSSPHSTSLDYKPRRFDYDSKSGTGIPSVSGDEFNCGERAQGIGFTQNGREYAVTVFVAADVNEQRLAEAYQMLNSAKLS